MNRFTHFLIVVLLLSGLTGCAEDEFFTACPFDKTINGVCDKESEEGQLTCVVKTHPQCAEDICIGYRGHGGVCSRVCTPGGGECPDGSTCVTYNELTEEYYCVPNEQL